MYVCFHAQRACMCACTWYCVPPASARSCLVVRSFNACMCAILLSRHIIVMMLCAQTVLYAWISWPFLPLPGFGAHNSIFLIAGQDTFTYCAHATQRDQDGPQENKLGEFHLCKLVCSWCICVRVHAQELLPTYTICMYIVYVYFACMLVFCSLEFVPRTCALSVLYADMRYSCRLTHRSLSRMCAQSCIWKAWRTPNLLWPSAFWMELSTRTSTTRLLAPIPRVCVSMKKQPKSNLDMGSCL